MEQPTRILSSDLFNWTEGDSTLLGLPIHTSFHSMDFAAHKKYLTAMQKLLPKEMNQQEKSIPCQILYNI